MSELVKRIATVISAKADDEINGKVLTRPALLSTDGNALIYVIDVDIGEDEMLRSVPVARANRDICYAEVGNPCRLRRTANGQWEVVGFSQEMPGTYTRIAINLTTLSYGPLEDVSLVARPLSYEELVAFGGYGVVAYGTTAIFRGGVLLELR